MESQFTDSASELTTNEVAQESPALETRRYWLIGLWLIGIGSVWIMRNLGYITWAWFERWGLILAGVALLSKTIHSRKYHVTFGAMFLMIGLFHLYLDYAEYPGLRGLWPMYFMIAGFSFLINFIFKISRWFSLVTGLLLVGFGGIMIARNFWLMPYEWAGVLRTYWPLTFILSGLILMGAAFIQYRKKSRF